MDGYVESILGAALGEYCADGFTLEWAGQSVLLLRHYGGIIGALSMGPAVIPVIHRACREHLESLDAS